MTHNSQFKEKGLADLLPGFIELETSTYCNRMCSWCPNSKYKRSHAQELISKELFEKIIWDLKEVDYSGQLALHNYNEPLLDPNLYEHISEIRQQLYGVKVVIFTNGDFLDWKECQKLEKNGVSCVYISLHDAINSPEPQKAALRQMAKLKRKGPLTDVSDRLGMKIKENSGKMRIICYIPHREMLTSRGGIISSLESENINSFCFLPFSSCAIDFEGNLKICCEIYPAHKLHRIKGIIGNLKEKSFSDLWFSGIYNDFRKEMLLNRIQNCICSHCPKNDIDVDKIKLAQWKRYLNFKRV